jgi:cell division protein FtsQ
MRPRLLASRWLRASRKYAAAGLALAILIGAPTWIWYSGWAERTLERVYHQTLEAAARVGFAVTDVRASGRRETSRKQVLAALGVRIGQPIFAFDPYRAKARLERLAWVKTVIVERRLPDTILVSIIERKPMALWQRNGKLALIDRQGVIIQKHGLGRFAHLPVVVGDDAPALTQELLNILRTQPKLLRRVEAMVRVGGRRWNLRMKNGIRVRLPEQGVGRAWARLAEAENRQKLLRRDVILIDLRLGDRMVVRIAPEAMRRRVAGKDT